MIGIATSPDFGLTWPTYKANFTPLPGVNPSQGPNAELGAWGSQVCWGNFCSNISRLQPPSQFGRYAVSGPVSSISEAIQFYKKNKAQSLAILAKYLRGLSSEDLEEAYPRYFYGFREKPYPSVKGVQTVLQWSKHPKAKDADPARFIERKFVESLDKPVAK